MEQYITDALENMGSKEEAFYNITDKAMLKETETGYENLTEGEKKLAGIGTLLMEVNNGGFDQYFFNTDGKYAEDTLEFINSCDMAFLARLLKDAILIYNSGQNDEYEDELDELDDKFYSYMDYEQLYSSCITYIKNNSEKF